MENGNQPINATLTYDQYSGEANGHLFGLTKREYFAGLAMQGMLANSAMVPNIATIEYLAKMSVKASDELLKQLEK